MIEDVEFELERQNVMSDLYLAEQLSSVSRSQRFDAEKKADKRRRRAANQKTKTRRAQVEAIVRRVQANLEFRRLMEVKCPVCKNQTALSAGQRIFLSFQNCLVWELCCATQHSLCEKTLCFILFNLGIYYLKKYTRKVNFNLSCLF